MSRNHIRSRLALLCGASLISIAAMAAPSLASAQTTDDQSEDVDDVIVTGIRASLASAQSIKQNSEQFVDSIVAVDIGKLPDVNVAEALQRISGIQITRNRGEGSSIAIRGLTQVRTELNGRDIFSTTDGRALSFEDVPSELLAGVDVYKNPSAAMIEGGIGGVVNLRTRMPFDAPGRVISGTVGGTWYDLREKWGGNVSGLISDRWDTGAGEMGALLNLSYSQAYFREDAITVEPFFERTDIPGYIGTPVQVAAGGGVSSWNGDRDRTGAAAAFQWRPNADVELYAQALYSQYHFYDPQTGQFGYGPSGSGGGLTPTPGVAFQFDDDGNMTYGSFSGGQFYQSFTRDAVRDSDTLDVSVGAKWNANDHVSFSTDLQYVDSSTFYDDVTGFGGLNGNPRLDVDLTGELPLFTIQPDSALADPAGYNYQALMVRTADNDGSELAWRGDMEWAFDDDSFAQSFSAGVRYTNKDVTTRESGFDWSAISGPPWDGSPGATANFDEFPDYYSPDPNIGNLFRGDGASIWNGAYFIVSPELLKDHTRALQVLGGELNPLSGAPTAPTARDQINVQNEETFTAYGLMRFASETSPIRFDGNLGLRVVSTKVTADGTQALTYRTAGATNTPITELTPYTGEQEYTEWLPSLNLRFFLQDNLYLRAAVSRGLSRPSFGDLAANFSLSENYIDADNNPTTPPVLDDRTGSGGNPLLNPLTTEQADLALEWYPSSSTSLYATAFYKKVHDFIQRGVYNAQYEVPGKGLQTFEISGPVNGEEGTIKGFEIGGNTFFDFLPGILSNFGVQANYTYVDSEAPSPTAVDSAGRALIVPLEFLSKNSYNLVGFYEDGPLNVRVAYNWRDDFVVTTAGNGTGNLPIYNADFGQLDASVSYDFNEHVSLSVDASNLLDEERHTYQAFPGRPRDYVLNDRRIGFRLRLRN
ncbi:TonB-dependent receptor [Brevundimonas sp. Leaf363]|uniref:TonB-dependent receptor n=1 Tax=Brevundimonas sp. Leaf363 TaxID=1736353 RepID=UPI000A663BEB|nr:TonB-dependent receptor [Brevundimonas sp. Leaf363]